jgi:hypothetical protein
LAYQLSTVTTKVQQRIKDTGYSTAEIANYLNDTQNDVFNEYPTLKFMKTSQNYTVTAGVADITNGSALPTDFSTAIDLINTTAGQEQVIPYMESDQIDLLYPDAEDTTRNPAGVPLYWYLDGVTPKLFPTPAAAYTLKLRYYKKPTELTGDADVPVIPSEFEELLVEGASFRVLQVKDNYDQAAIHENRYLDLRQQLVTKYSIQQTGSVHTMPISRFRTSSRRLDTIYRRI